MNRAGVLDAARAAVLVDRAATHGAPEASFGLIAALWSALLRQNVTPQQVALMLGALKTARAWDNPGHEDNYVDLAGYAACAAEVAGPELSPQARPWESHAGDARQAIGDFWRGMFPGAFGAAPTEPDGPEPELPEPAPSEGPAQQAGGDDSGAQTPGDATAGADPAAQAAIAPPPPAEPAPARAAAPRAAPRQAAPDLYQRLIAATQAKVVLP